MVDQAPTAEQYPGNTVKLVCPRCRFVIAAFTADEVEHDRIKRRRYHSLLSRQQLCGGCLCTVRKLEALWES